MKNKVLYFVSFALGAAIGGYASWMYAKNKYFELAQEEIDSVKKAFSEPIELVVKEEPKKKTPKKVEPDESPVSIVEENSYSTKKRKKGKAPYVITPTEFGEKEGYNNFSLIYFADGVLTDDEYDIIDNVDELVGKDSLTHFGEYEDDSVFVRNDPRKSDYEILWDSRNYCDVKHIR